MRVLQIREPRFVHKGIRIASMGKRLAVECVRRVTYPILTNAFMGGGSPVLTPNMIVLMVRE